MAKLVLDAEAAAFDRYIQHLNPKQPDADDAFTTKHATKLLTTFCKIQLFSEVKMTDWLIVPDPHFDPAVDLSLLRSESLLLS